MNRRGARRVMSAITQLIVFGILCAAPGVHAQQTSSPPETATPAAPPTFTAQWEQGALSLTAERADLTSVLKRIGEITGTPVEISAGVTGEVTIAFSKLSLEEAIGKILEAAGAKSYAASFEKTPLTEGFRLEKIRVVPKGAAEPGNERSGFLRTFEGTREYLKKKYGTEWNVDWPEDRSGQRSQRPGELRGHVPVPHRITDLANGRVFVESTLAELSELLQLNMKDIVLEKSKEHLAAFGYFYRQIHNGVPVDAGQISVSLFKEFVDGRQRLRIGNSTYPGIDLPTEPKVSAESAARTAEVVYKTKVWHEGKGRSKLLIYAKPIKERIKDTLRDAVTGYKYHLVWEFDFEGWEQIRIDALSGALVTAGHSSVKNSQYRLQTNRYGVEEGEAYLDARDASSNLRRSDGPLQGLHIWKQGDPPASPSITTLDDGTFSTDGGFPLTMKLSGPRLRVYHDSDPGTPEYDEAEFPGEITAADLPNPGATFTIRAGADPQSVSTQHNVYHQVRRGLKKFSEWGVAVAGVGASGQDPGVIEVRAGYPLATDAGQAANGKIALSGAGGTSSDVILHELTHLAVETEHTTGIGSGRTQEGVEEGLADYFACSINKDAKFSNWDGLAHEYDLEVDHKPTDYGPEACPGDLNRDAAYDAADWEHYDNGEVIASILWDLTKHTDPTATCDEAVLQSLDLEYLDRFQYKPEELYGALQTRFERAGMLDKCADLWQSFSTHGVNLSAASDGVAMRLHWFKYFRTHAGFRVERSTDKDFSNIVTLVPGVAQTEWIDNTLTTAGTYWYRVVPVDANGNAVGDPATTEARFSGLPAPKNLRIANVAPYGDGVSRIIVIDLLWDPVAASAEHPVGGYKVFHKRLDSDRWEVIDPGNLNWSTNHAQVPTADGKLIDEYFVRAYYVVNVAGKDVTYYSPPSATVHYPASLDLAILMQTYFPYYNFATSSLKRYRAALSNLLTALAGAGLPAGRINMIDLSAPQAEKAPEGYFGAQMLLAGSPPFPPGSTTPSATLLDVGLQKAKDFLDAPEGDLAGIRKALIFTNWLHYDPSLCSAGECGGGAPCQCRLPKVSGTQANAPFADEVAAFGFPGPELDAVDFYSGTADGYAAVMMGELEWRFPFGVPKYFEIGVKLADDALPRLEDGKVGFQILQKPSDQEDSEKLSLNNQRLLFPWINGHSAQQYRLRPGERAICALPVDATMGRLSIGITGIGSDAVRLVRPDDSAVAITRSGAAVVTDDPGVRAVGGSDSLSLLVEAPQAGAWRVELDGEALTKESAVAVRAYTSSIYRVDETVPPKVRPGEVFPIDVRIGSPGQLGETKVRIELTREQGSVYELGSRVVTLDLRDDGEPGDVTAADGEFVGMHVVQDLEGTLKYRVKLEGRDSSGNAVHRESDGSIFVQGDAPVIASPAPIGELVEESPRTSVLVADDVKLGDYTIRVDGRALQVIPAEVAPASVAGQFTAPAADWQPRQVKRLTGQVDWVLAPGEHTVEVTASDTIAQEAAPESWTFRVGSGLLATDAVGDDWGPGYYSYPTDPALMPRGALDLEGFRVYRDGSLISLNIDLRNYFEFYAPPTLTTLSSVVDVYLDTDGLSGSGRTDLLPGRNAQLRPQDAWEYCLTISREGAKLISASGSETPVAVSFNAGTATLSVSLQNVQLGVSDPRALEGWGYLVATLGYDGLNSGHVKEVTTLGGAHVFGGGAEGNWDPNLIDLLASGTAQQTMLGSYSVPQGRHAVLTAYRFANPAPIDDHRAPVLAAFAPTGVVATNPPQIGFTATDDWGLDPGQFQLWVDGGLVASGALVVTGNNRQASVRHLPGAAPANGRHEVRAQARDQAGNTAEVSWEFVVGASAHIATVGGAARAEGMALRGSVQVVGTAAGGTSWRLAHSADGVAWAPIASGTTDLPAGALGSWTTSAVDDGSYTLQLKVAGGGGSKPMPSRCRWTIPRPTRA